MPRRATASGQLGVPFGRRPLKILFTFLTPCALASGGHLSASLAILCAATCPQWTQKYSPLYMARLCVGWVDRRPIHTLVATGSAATCLILLYTTRWPGHALLAKANLSLNVPAQPCRQLAQRTAPAETTSWCLDLCTLVVQELETLSRGNLVYSASAILGFSSTMSLSNASNLYWIF